MLRPIFTLITMVVCVRYGQSSSVPVHCETMNCDEGTICMVFRSGPCTARRCPSLEAQCVPISTKPGECPGRLENEACRSLNGVPLCWLDEDCDGRQKCCGGCCKTPDPELTLEQKIALLKPGACPAVDNIELALRRLWTHLYCVDDGPVDKCLTDFDCPETLKCCTTLCGNECKPAIHVAGGVRFKPTGEETDVIPQKPLINPVSREVQTPVIEPRRPQSQGQR